MTGDRALRSSMAAATGLAIALGPAAGVALPDPTTASDAATVDRSLHLQGVPNARDAGGYRTTDGHWVRTGLVYRTGQLDAATLADLAALTERKVHVVDDLRTVYERMIAPDRVPAGATERWYDVIGQAPPQVIATALTGGDGLYRAFVSAPGASQAIAAVLRDIIETKDGAVLFHCTSGTDRTGWTAAVLLTILGVDRDTVTQDYLLSNQYRTADDPLGGVQAHWLEAAFDQADQIYGGFDNYVLEGLQLTHPDIAALKARLLV